MCCYQKSMLLLAAGISMRMLNSRERKEVWRNSRVAPELNWINEVHTFVVHNQNHPQMIEIHAELKRLSGLMHDAIYVPSMKFVLHNVEEDEKVVHLCHHSEKTD
jgi:hypothetical protein